MHSAIEGPSCSSSGLHPASKNCRDVWTRLCAYSLEVVQALNHGFMILNHVPMIQNHSNRGPMTTLRNHGRMTNQQLSYDSLHERPDCANGLMIQKLTIVPHFSPSITANSWTSMIFAHSESCKSLIFYNLCNHGVHAANHERAAG